MKLNLFCYYYHIVWITIGTLLYKYTDKIQLKIELEFFTKYKTNKFLLYQLRC
jgi:hypothetical protein